MIFSTIGFGMSVDVPDIRTVVHYRPSSGIEDYVQESGRAGTVGMGSHVKPFYLSTLDVCLVISPKK